LVRFLSGIACRTKEQLVRFFSGKACRKTEQLVRFFYDVPTLQNKNRRTIIEREGNFLV